jgi:23S rRNA pseudouridine1911/1915/1917 synthase
MDSRSGWQALRIKYSPLCSWGKAWLRGKNMGLIEGTIQADEPIRFDRYLAEVRGLLSRSQLKTRFVALRINGKVSKLSRMVEDGDGYSVEILDEMDRSSASEPECIPLSILYEDHDVIVVDKPQGMVVHPAHGNWSGTLANALLGHLAAAGASGEAPPRAGIVHRLDKDTSGVIIAGKNAASQEYLASQFRDRTTAKTYVAIVAGRPAMTAGRIDDALARDPRDRKRWARAPEGTGKRAVTDWRVIAGSAGYSVLALNPRTGRTHQLRVHCKGMGCPILGDPVYGRPDKRFPRCTLLLHALELRITLPGAIEASVFSAPLPERFRSVAAALGIDPFPDPLSGNPV